MYLKSGEKQKKYQRKYPFVCSEIDYLKNKRSSNDVSTKRKKRNKNIFLYGSLTLCDISMGGSKKPKKSDVL